MVLTVERKWKYTREFSLRKQLAWRRVYAFDIVFSGRLYPRGRKRHGGFYFCIFKRCFRNMSWCYHNHNGVFVTLHRRGTKSWRLLLNEANWKPRQRVQLKRCDGVSNAELPACSAKENLGATSRRRRDPSSGRRPGTASFAFADGL